jgi:hypothetical protein
MNSTRKSGTHLVQTCVPTESRPHRLSWQSLGTFPLVLFLLVGLQKASGQTAGAIVKGGESGAVVEVRPSPNQVVRMGGPFVAALGHEIVVDIQSADKFFQYLIDRQILVDPRPGKDANEREADKNEEGRIKNLPEAERGAALKKLQDVRAQRFQNAVDAWIQQMSLFLDGHPIPGLSPEWTYRWDEYSADAAQPSTRYDAVEFRLSKTDENREAWLDLLRGSGIKDRATTVTVGFNKVFGDRTDLILSQINVAGAKKWQRFSIRTAPRMALVASALIILLMLILCIRLAVCSNLLRDTSASPNPGGRHPFSLGLCQMAFWLFILAASFLFLWVVTGEYNTLTGSELALLGISASTGLAAVFIDQMKVPCETSVLTFEELQERNVQTIREARKAAERAWTEALQTLHSKRAQLSSAPDSVAAQKEMADISAKADLLKQRVDELKERERYFSPLGRVRQFFLDLLQERDSVDFHRFQMITWTLILGLIFVIGVCQELAMPKFDATLLILMGISSGTYLGFKWPAVKGEL